MIRFLVDIIINIKGIILFLRAQMTLVSTQTPWLIDLGKLLNFFLTQCLYFHEHYLYNINGDLSLLIVLVLVFIIDTTIIIILPSFQCTFCIEGSSARVKNLNVSLIRIWTVYHFQVLELLIGTIGWWWYPPHWMGKWFVGILIFSTVLRYKCY